MRDHSAESFSDGTPVPEQEPPAGKSKGPSQAQILVGMAEDTYRLIRAGDGRAYAVPRLGPQIAVPLASKSENSLRTRLAASLHRQTGQVASSSNLSDAITVLIGEAADLEPVPVWLRAARQRRHRRDRHGHRDRAGHHHHRPRLVRRARLAGHLPPLRAHPPAGQSRSGAAPWTGCGS